MNEWTREGQLITWVGGIDMSQSLSLSLIKGLSEGGNTPEEVRLLTETLQISNCIIPHTRRCHTLEMKMLFPLYLG